MRRPAAGDQENPGTPQVHARVAAAIALTLSVAGLVGLTVIVVASYGDA